MHNYKLQDENIHFPVSIFLFRKQSSSCPVRMDEMRDIGFDFKKHFCNIKNEVTIYMKYLLGLILITAFFPKDVRAEIFGRFSLQIGIGSYDKALVDYEDSDENITAFSGILAFSYKRMFPIESIYSSVGFSARVQANLVADLENRHLYSVLGGVSFINALYPVAIRILGGYGYSGENISGFVWGFELGIFDLLILNIINASNKTFDYTSFTVSIDIILLFQVFKIFRSEKRLCDGGINPSKDCPHFPALD